MSLHYTGKERARQTKVAFLGVGYRVLLFTTLTTLSQASRVVIYQKDAVDDLTKTIKGTDMVETSYVNCALSCSTKYDNCFKFMYNSEKKTCTPTFIANLTTTNPTPTTSTNNLDVYKKTFPTPPVTARTMNKTSCKGTDGYNLHTYGSVTACLKFYDENQNYFQADINCWKDEGAYLVSVKTMDKLQAVRNVSANLKEAWVGCDDLALEGTYVWKEDDERFTKATSPPVFAFGEPNNSGGATSGSANSSGANCIYLGQYLAGVSFLFDYKCNDGKPYVCEKPYN